MIDVGRRYRIVAHPGCPAELKYHGIHPHIIDRIVIVEAFEVMLTDESHYWRVRFADGGNAGWFTTDELERVDEYAGLPRGVGRVMGAIETVAI